MKIDAIRENPNNPRLIDETNFEDLCRSIQKFPQMMELRPIVVDDDGVILGGNMRFKALKKLGYKTIDRKWVKYAKELTEEQKKEFLIKDNVGFGKWDAELLGEWDDNSLKDWGIDMSFKNSFPPIKEVDFDDGEKWFVNVEFNSEKECQDFYEEAHKKGYTCKIVQ